jgi:hypothetical protein
MFSINFTYVSGNMPDSCIIVLKASGSAPANGDYLWVDNLAFSGTATSVENHPSITSVINDLHVFYNSSGNNISVDFNLSKSQNIKIQMIDLNGRLIKEDFPGTLIGISKYSISTDGISNGAYFIAVIANECTEVKKVMIK